MMYKHLVALTLALLLLPSGTTIDPSKLSSVIYVMQCKYRVGFYGGKYILVDEKDAEYLKQYMKANT